MQLRSSILRFVRLALLPAKEEDDKLWSRGSHVVEINSA
jgi:hypothetical protein